MNTPSSLLTNHHRRCDGLFAEAEEQIEEGDWTRCLLNTQHFADELLAHFAVEEEALFPAFERATGMTTGPTRLMRIEHDQMRELVRQLIEAAETRQRDTFFGISDTLVVLMEQHNLKEENVLYPMCDQAVGHDTALVGELENAVAEGRIEQ